MGKRVTRNAQRPTLSAERERRVHCNARDRHRSLCTVRMSSPANPDPLAPLLDDAEAELRRRLEEACSAEAENLATKSSAEIRELEDSLLAAAVAARQTLALRERIGESRSQEADVHDASLSPPDDPALTADGARVAGVREFTDTIGRTWRAWLVTPASSRSGLGQFQQGWICFETTDNTARRRLPCQRAVWSGVRDEELEQLLQQAITVPDRKSTRRAPPSPRA